MLPEINTVWWLGMRKDIESECSVGTACMSSGKIQSINYSRPKKITPSVLNELGKEIQIAFFGELHKENVIGVPYTRFGND